MNLRDVRVLPSSVQLPVAGSVRCYQCHRMSTCLGGGGFLVSTPEGAGRGSSPERESSKLET